MAGGLARGTGLEDVPARSGAAEDDPEAWGRRALSSSRRGRLCAAADQAVAGSAERGTGWRREAADCWREEEQARHASGRCREPTARQHLHEPVPEALASKWTWRRVPCSCRLLRRRLRHPQPRSCGRGAGVDEGGDDQARVDPQRGQDLAEGCPEGTLQLPWLLVWPALPLQP